MQVSSRRCRSWAGGQSSSVGAALAWGTPSAHNQVASTEAFYRRNRGEGTFSRQERLAACHIAVYMYTVPGGYANWGHFQMYSVVFTGRPYTST